MGKNNTLGLEGEQLASDYLKNKGWIIHEMNYRFSRSEIDLIAAKNDLLIFVEVKTRTNTSFGLPEEFVDEKKQKISIKLQITIFVKSIGKETSDLILLRLLKSEAWKYCTLRMPLVKGLPLRVRH